MSEITFYSTNNAWTNNGLIMMAQKMHYDYENEIKVEYADDSISLKSLVKTPVTDFIAETMQTLAGNGTYNISTAFKVLNNDEKLGSNYSFQDYPRKNGDSKETENITDEERDYLKKNKYSDNKKKQQIWKMRMSYLAPPRSSEDVYLKMGLNFKEQHLFNKLTSYEKGKNICPLCGMPSKTMEDVKEFYNPLFGEHHNNEVEGIGATRKKAKICPKCTILSYFALFDYYIPFYRTRKGEVYLTIPNTVNLDILRKISANLSSNGQYVDFNDGECKSYGTNIKGLPTNSRSASLIALLHNIKNKYHPNEPKSLGMGFEEVTEKDFKEITDWLFISKSRRITQIKSDENIYKILEPFEDKKGPDVYLVPHFLNSFSFDIFNENEVEKFFNGILTLDSKKIADGLFRISKESISNVNKIWVKYLPQNSSPLYLFTELFLEKIMGESTMLEDNLKDACKSVGKTIGKGFSEDVGMLTKFAYSSGPDEFKKALEDASFRLAKISALDIKKSFYLDANNLEILMNSMDQNNFSDLKTYFVSFMSSYVLSENYKKKQQKKEQRA